MVFRASFLCFMTWLLVAFLPAHTRGRITMGPKSSDDCCAPVAVKDDCCVTQEPSLAPKQPGKNTTKHEHQPSATDRANCAVCFWAAGLLSDIAVAFDHAFAEAAFDHARHYDAQVKCVALRLNHHGRDPPASIAL